MLTLARESREMTLVQLADRLGVTQGYLSKLAHGLIDIPEGRLPDISAELDYPVEFFYQYPELQGDQTPCLFHRKRQAVPAVKLRAIQAQARVSAVAVDHLLQDIEVEVGQSFPRMDIEDYDRPEEIAQRARQHWRLAPGPIRNLTRLIESAGGVVVRRVFGTRKVDAISQWPPNGRPMFIVNADIPTDRLRFTLAHEIGHIIMHTLLSDDPETEANRFAAEFLMPAQDIAPDLVDLSLPRLAALKAYWRVAMSALVVRAHRLGAITERQYRRFMTTLKARYGVVEPNPLSPEEPTVVGDALAVHRDVHHFTVPELCAATRLCERDFREIFMPRTSLRIVTT